MKNTLLRILMGVVIMLPGYLSAQNKVNDFINYKNLPNGQKVIYFELAGIGGSEQLNQILSNLQNDKNVFYNSITADDNGKYRCKATVDSMVDAAYIRNILQLSGAEINMASLISKESPDFKKEIIPSKMRSDGMPEHYPVYENTGNPDYDNSVYEQAKQEWIKNYPVEVELLTGRQYEKIVPGKKENNN